ncbi:hypothetical protein [Elizabethkingia anophelis]|uniref:hypothetical protein n=1 Tax=Elizabethkingia anophelis TaxID=1117645 RepID=UPI0013706CC8|nr:hypothetical protein [Elizabethkingia anophelis]MYY43986.1 hypothetical protein [Elizabethkingia anophelis]
MKAFNEMDNLDKATLLFNLFPHELKNLRNAVQQQCNYFLENEKAIREGWQSKGFFTAEFWFMLVKSANNYSSRNRLIEKPEWFIDHFFDGYIVLFTTHCLMEYTDDTQCYAELKRAIYFLFGDERILKITLEK